MPYTLDSLPSNIKKLPAKKQKQFMAVFNQAIEDGKTESDAFKLANGVIKKQGKAIDFSMSFEEISNQLRMALREQFSPSGDKETFYPWIAQTYFSHIIAEVEGKYWSISYVVIDGEVEFSDRGDWTEVQHKEVWIEKKAIEDFLKAGARHSRKDSGMVQTIHDHAVSLGASCGEGKTIIPRDEIPNLYGLADESSLTLDNGNHLKSISETETEYRAGNYLALFNGKDLEGIASPNKNADGSIGEYFSKATDFESTYTQTGMLYVDWEHGRDDLSQDEVLGYVDWKSAKVDEKGLWVERVLNRRNKYVQWLKTLIDSGLVGTSSEPVQSRIAKAIDGHITRWPLKRDTLTVTPMEPRMLNENTLTALKALADCIPCVKNACLKAGLLSNDLGTKETELSIQANLAYINSVLEV